MNRLWKRKRSISGKKIVSWGQESGSWARIGCRGIAGNDYLILGLNRIIFHFGLFLHRNNLVSKISILSWKTEVGFREKGMSTLSLVCLILLEVLPSYGQHTGKGDRFI